MNEINVLELAEAIARQALEGQFRYDGVTPAIVHSEGTAALLTDPDDKAAAWLHDTIEDSNGRVTAATLLAAGIPQHIVDAVVALTQNDGESYPDYHRRVAKNAIAARVKIADMCNNLSSSPTLKSTRQYSYLIAHLTLGTPLPETYKGLI